MYRPDVLKEQKVYCCVFGVCVCVCVCVYTFVFVHKTHTVTVGRESFCAMYSITKPHVSQYGKSAKLRGNS